MEGADRTIYPDGRQIRSIRAGKAGEYDAIFDGYAMPVMNGLEATAAIRNNKINWGKTIRFAAMTANAFSFPTYRQCLMPKMNAHLSKAVGNWNY